MRRRGAAALAVAALLGGACGDGASGGAADGGHDHGGGDDASSSTASTAPPFTKAEADTVLDVTMQDYAFVGLPDTVAGPNVHLTASIKGSNFHELLLDDEDGELVEDLRPFKRPARQAFAVVLEPGTYTVECLVKEGSRTHAELGMRKTFTVTHT